MEWIRVAVVVERYEKLARNGIKELHQLHQNIIQMDSMNDRINGASDRRNARRKIDQILNGLYQVLELRAKLSLSDQEHFDLRIEPIRLQIQATVNALNSVCALDYDKTSADDVYMDLYEQSSAEEPVVEKKQATLLKDQVEEIKEKAEKTSRIAMDIDDLNEAMVQLSQLILAQHETVDSIEEHVEKSSTQIKRAERSLKKAQVAKSAKYPLIAAAVGGVAAGGPVGIVAGSAIAGVCAAVGGAVAGLYGGRFFKRKAQEAANGPSA